MHSGNWDNLRYVLSVAEHGSVSAAARALGVNHATVLRHVAAFEDAHGGPVFEKTATGYRVLPARATVIDAAREVANAIGSVERLMQGGRASVRGLVRVSSTDSLCQVILPPLVARLHALSPELQIDIMSTNSHLDFARLQADIAVRPARSLPDEMRGETGAIMTFRAYALPGAPENWLGMSGPLARSVPAAWMASNLGPEATIGGSDSFMVLREMALAGLGIAVLPAFLGDRTAGLQPRPELMPELSVPVWVATFAELRDVPRIRIVCEQIVEFLKEQAASLRGTTA